MKIFINGFGRIGRCVLRAILERSDNPQLEVIGINDPANWEILAYLLEHDSAHGLLNKETHYSNGKLIIGSLEIPVFNSIKDLRGVDVIIECSGKFLEPKTLENYLLLGAKKVLLSAPFMGEYDENNTLPWCMGSIILSIKTRPLFLTPLARLTLSRPFAPF